MENNVFEQMGASGVEAPETKPVVTETESAAAQVDRSAETTLNVIATIVLVFGIFASLVCLVTICWIKEPGFYTEATTKFNPAGLGITVSVLITSVTTWAVLRVLANISNSLKDLNSKK